jgi:predicted nucleic acid-binding protein
MTVVSDTSPINYLVLIELQDLLPALFEHVLTSPQLIRAIIESA